MEAVLGCAVRTADGDFAGLRVSKGRDWEIRPDGAVCGSVGPVSAWMACAEHGLVIAVCLGLTGMGSYRRRQLRRGLAA